MKKFSDFLYICLTIVIFSSCHMDEEITAMLPPKIVLDNETGIYAVKQGREITISPTYEFAEDATYSWKINGKIVGTQPSLSFMSDEVGEFYITISITTEGGVDEEEIRIDVVELEIPTISIAGNKNLTVVTGSEIKFNATVRETSFATTITWSVNDKNVGDGLEYVFTANEVGNYTIIATAANQDGVFNDTVKVEMLHADDMPFVWDFEQTTYHTVVGRKLLMKPIAISNDEQVTYLWQKENDTISTKSQCVYIANETGSHYLTAIASIVKGDKQITLTRNFVVKVYEEGVFYRQANNSSKADWNKVYEYTPAPGQFINELKTGGFDGTQTTHDAAIAYAESRMSSTWVSLGGFGGYIVVGFDHSIDNSGGYDLAILGNSFDGSSEPGIVWVMQDENGNGLPDDTWYELAGSETGKPETIQNYSVTYYRPTGPQMAVQWKDNLGNSGQIDYLKQFHTQDYYYPLWIKEDSYTLTGTCLQARNYDQSNNGSYWVNKHYDWGYVDNWSTIDQLTEDTNISASANANHFKISNAVDFECKPVNLKFIDFVKVQVGVNAKSGWLGEISTEVFGFYDYHLKK